jgi:hypothetical protein
MGPCTTPSYSGSLYTQFTWVYFMKEKSKVFFRFKEFKATMESVLNKKIKRFRTDNGGKFTSINFHNFCQEHGIRRELYCAYSLQQNGVAERKIRHLVETCRSWLYAKNLTKALWAEGMACVVYVIDRVPFSPINMKSPYELTFEEKPSVKHFKVFGFICYVHVPDAKRTKLDAKTQKCTFIGYDERKKGGSAWIPRPIKFAFHGMYLMKSLHIIRQKVLFLEVLVVTLVLTISRIHKSAYHYHLMLLCHRIALLLLLLLHLWGRNQIGGVVLVAMS